MKDENHRKTSSEKEKRPPKMWGAFSTEEILEARKTGQLLSIWLMLSKKCDLKCPYCFSDAGKKNPTELTLDEIKSVIMQLKDLGGKTVHIPGAGEPLIDPNFREVVDFIDQLGLNVVLFTNGTQITRDMADYLYSKRVSVFLKFNSFDKKIQNELVGDKSGTYSRKRDDALMELFYRGFNRLFSENGTTYTRLGLTSSIMSLNYHEAPKFLRFCRDNNLNPSMDYILRKGRGRDCLFHVDKERVKEMFFELRDLDKREYGYEWVALPAYISGRCSILYHNMLIDEKGWVTPCLGIDFKVANVREKSLRDIWESELIQKTRNIDSNLTGKCAECRHRADLLCYGCPGRRYQNYAVSGFDEKSRLDKIFDSEEGCWAFEPF